MAKDMHDIDACSKIFCSWVWMIGIVISLMGAGVAAAWAGSKKIAETDAIIQIHDKRICNIEIQTAKIDTVIKILRENK
jgi:hypothetical protein